MRKNYTRKQISEEYNLTIKTVVNRIKALQLNCKFVANRKSYYSQEQVKMIVEFGKVGENYVSTTEAAKIIKANGCKYPLSTITSYKLRRVMGELDCRKVHGKWYFNKGEIAQIKFEPGPVPNGYIGLSEAIKIIKAKGCPFTQKTITLMLYEKMPNIRNIKVGKKRYFNIDDINGLSFPSSDGYISTKEAAKIIKANGCKLRLPTIECKLYAMKNKLRTKKVGRKRYFDPEQIKRLNFWHIPKGYVPTKEAIKIAKSNGCQFTEFVIRNKLYQMMGEMGIKVNRKAYFNTKKVIEWSKTNENGKRTTK